MKKKLLKKFLNENGFFYNSMKLDTSKNAPMGVAVPEGAKYFEGVVSNGELNRNGYIIRPQALIDSLGVYMMNPIILLGHDTDQPVGRCLSAVARGASGKEQEIFVTGYIYDEYTDGRFGRGLLNALSTGHITEEVEFENSETGEILSAEEFRKFNWEEQCNGKWIMAVTKLEWVEFSSVSIGSNRKSLITAKNAIEAFVKSEKFCANALRDVVGSELDEEVEEKKEEQKDVQKGEQTEVKVKKEEGGEEKPADETTTETKPKEEEAANDAVTAPVETEETAAKSGEGDNAEATEGDEEVNKIRISKADREKLQQEANKINAALEATIATNDEEPKEAVEEKKAEDETAKVEEKEKPKQALSGDEEGEEKPVVEEKTEGNSVKIEVAPEVKNALIELVKLNADLTKEVAALELKLSKVPHIKGLAIVSQFKGEAEKKDNKPAPGVAILSMLQQCGFNV